MPSPFSRTLRSLEADSAGRPSAVVLLLVGLVVGWIAWLFAARVAVYEVTAVARLEVKAAAHPVSARIDGLVIESLLDIGRAVRAGDVIVTLDSAAEELALAQGRARVKDLEARIVAIRDEIRAEETSIVAHLKAGDIAIEESKARVKEAEARARFADEQARVVRSLEASGTASSEAVRQAEMEASAGRAVAEAQGAARARLEQDRVVEEADRRALLSKLRREAVELEGLLSVEEASNRRLDREIELRSIRSPIDGRVGEANDLRAGAVVSVGEKLGAIVPAGEPRAVAFFPVEAVGRIRVGQDARLRMDGFPWTRYGTLSATVSEVASEPRDGRVRVELGLGDNSASRIPLEHGITGSAEISVERLSPATLVLRAAGELLSEKTARGGGGGA